MTTIATTLTSAEADQADRDIYITIDRKDRVAINQAKAAIRAAHAAHLAEIYAPAGLNVEALSAIYEQAWEQGHSSGFQDVESAYIDLSCLIGKVISTLR